MTDDHEDSLLEKKEGKMIGHLLALRLIILRSLCVYVIILLGLFFYSNDLYLFFSKPLRAYMPEDGTMIATSVTSPFLAPFKLTAMIALFIVIPFILHQVWCFISPGLYKREKVFAVPILFISVFLFYIGVVFSYYVVFPILFSFFIQAAPDTVRIMTDINQYLDFSMTLLLVFGLCFEIPIGVFLLVFSGVVTVDKLKSMRPGIVVGCFVVGMLLTPPDVFSQSLLAVPMWGLFEIGVFFSQMALKYQNK